MQDIWGKHLQQKGSEQVAQGILYLKTPSKTLNEDREIELYSICTMANGLYIKGKIKKGPKM